MIGHEIRLSRTNGYGWVPLCQCGWIGNVVPHVSVHKDETARAMRVRELTQAIARTQHGEHLHDVREDVTRWTDRALADHGRRIDPANATLQHRGRYGHP